MWSTFCPSCRPHRIAGLWLVCPKLRHEMLTYCSRLGGKMDTTPPAFSPEICGWHALFLILDWSSWSCRAMSTTTTFLDLVSRLRRWLVESADWKREMFRVWFSRGGTATSASPMLRVLHTGFNYKPDLTPNKTSIYSLILLGSSSLWQPWPP
jgi:hypothetical protein